MDLDSAIRQAEALDRSAEMPDTATAPEHWTALGERFPADPRPYLAGIVSLRDTRRYAAAMSLAEHARAAFPDSAAVLTEHCWVAHFEGRWETACLLWCELRERFPEDASGFFGGASALRSLGRFDHADALYNTAIGRWPDATNLKIDQARLAFERGRIDDTLAMIARIKEQDPRDEYVYLLELEVWRANGPTERLMDCLQEIDARSMQVPPLLAAKARIEAALKLDARALRTWETLMRVHAGLEDGHLGAAQLLNQLGRHADAETLLKPAVRRFPRSETLAGEFAWTAHYREDFDAALARWASFREIFPASATAYTGLTATLLKAGRPEEARTVNAEALEAFPDNQTIRLDSARILHETEAWSDAVPQWRAILERYPANVEAIGKLATALARTGQPAEAMQLLASHADLRDPGAALLGGQLAALHEQQGDRPRAAEILAGTIIRHPDVSELRAHLSSMLRRLGRLSEAEEVLRAARAAGLNDVNIDLEEADTATARRDWGGAFPRWLQLIDRYPEDPGMIDGLNRAVSLARTDMAAGLADTAGAAIAIPPRIEQFLAGREARQSASAALLMRFESIGDSCEFGMVQRRFGVETISLLRWASIQPQPLVRLLEARLEGFGEADTTRVEEINGEYTTRDTRYQVFSHTFTAIDAMPADQFLRQHLRRTRFLKEKFVADLAQAEKILVYKFAEDIPPGQVDAIFAALRAYHPAPRLLCVTLTTDPARVGTLDVLAPGLLLGFVDRFSTVDINHYAWLALCRRAAELADGQDVLVAA